MRPVDADLAIEEMKKLHEADCEYYGCDIPDECFDDRRAINILIDLPTIEIQKKGRWIKMSDADGIYYACSECGEDIPRVPHYNPQFDLFPRLKSIEKTNFCPNCGAKME